MRKAVIAALIFANIGSASAAETIAGKIACTQMQYFEEFVKFAAAKDMGSIKAYLELRKCMQMKGGLKVTVLEYPGMLSGAWMVSFQGTKFYVQREGIATD